MAKKNTSAAQKSAAKKPNVKAKASTAVDPKTETVTVENKPDQNPDNQASGINLNSSTDASGINSSDYSEEKRKISVVIPYLESAAKGNELLYALRAWEKNFKEDFEIVIIGDKPDFLSEEVLHIAAIDLGANPQLDVTYKLMQAIASHLVSDTFILSNDDIYPVNPISIEDLLVHRISGKLGDSKQKAGEAYLERLQLTKSLLEAKGRDTDDYATHLPVVYEKGKLSTIIEEFQADKQGLLLSSLYFNTKEFPNDTVLTKGGLDGDHVVYVYRANPRLEVIQHGFEHRKFVNHNNDGYLPTLPFLQQAFPDKSKFEK